MNHTIGGTKARVLRFVSLTVLSALFMVYIVPFALLILNSFKNKRDIITSPFALGGKSGFTLQNFTTAFGKMDFMRALGNSVLITGLSTFFIILLASATAYYFVRSKNKISKFVFILMTASMIIPFQAIMIPLVSIYGAGLNILNHRLTLIFFHTGFALSMSVFMYDGFIRSSISISLEEAAYLEGCSGLQTFRLVVFPLLKPITSTLVILNVLAVWNDYLLPSLVLSDKKLLTLPLSTYLFYGTYSADYGTIMASLVLTILPILALFIFLQKHIISGITSGAVKS